MKTSTIHEQFDSFRKVVNLVSAKEEVVIFVTLVTLFLHREVLRIRTINQDPNEPSPLAYQLKLSFNSVLKRRNILFLLIHFLVTLHHLNQAILEMQMF
jgi:hypothetical protein